MIVELLGACLCGWTLYVGGVAITPFLFARGSIRLRGTGEEVRLRALDAIAMFYAGFALSGPGFAALAAVTGSVVLAIPLTLLLWFGFRLKLVVTTRGIRATRYFLYVVPWWFWRRVSPVQPTAFVDGWGDCADPEALHLTLWQGGPTLEVAWGDAGSGDKCEMLANEFNRAVSGLSTPAPSE